MVFHEITKNANTNIAILNANRSKILDNVFPPDGQYRRLVYGTDKNYEVKDCYPNLPSFKKNLMERLMKLCVEIKKI